MKPGCGRTLPETIADRCVHTRMEQASCRACVDACPRRAWVIDDERLGIDAELCDGCGLCAPACPEEAIVERFDPVRYRVGGTLIAFAACTRAGVQGEVDAVLPCLHVLGVGTLLGLHRQGVRSLLMRRGDCGVCPRGDVTRVDRSLEQASALLADRGLDPLVAVELDPGRWARSLGAARASHRTPALGRRAFFRGVLAAATATAVELVERVEPRVADFVPPGRLPARTNGGRLSLYAPRIDPDRCTGCDACARLCPHAVILSEADAYRFDPDGCTGCGICIDVCHAEAVTVHTLDAAPQTLLPLRRRRCPACGVPFHTPRLGAGSGDLCPICTASSHHKRLYQVLDRFPASRPETNGATSGRDDTVSCAAAGAIGAAR